MTVLYLLAIPRPDAKFRGDDDAATIGFERFAHQFFIRVWSVNLGRIKEGHAAIDGGTQQRNAFFLVDGCAVRIVQTHATESDCRNFKATLSKLTFFHLVSLFPRLLSVTFRKWHIEVVSIAIRPEKFPPICERHE